MNPNVPASLSLRPTVTLCQHRQPPRTHPRPQQTDTQVIERSERERERAMGDVEPDTRRTLTRPSSAPVKTYCPVRSNLMQNTGFIPWPLAVTSGRIRSSRRRADVPVRGTRPAIRPVKRLPPALRLDKMVGTACRVSCFTPGSERRARKLCAGGVM